MKLKSHWLIYSLLIAFGQSVNADTHYVSTTGSNSGSCTNPGAPCATLQYALGQMAGGDTLEIGAGTYSGSSNNLNTDSNSGLIPNGSVGNFTTIKAAVDGTVDINAQLSLNINSSYISFEGLKFSYSASNFTKNISGNHVKVLRTAFVNGAQGNNQTLSLGKHDNQNTSHILLEDVWAYGTGGRYNILVYNSSNIVVRRAVIRHDAGWSCDGSNPESGITIYNSRNVELQNVLVVDSISDVLGACQGISAFYNVSNSSGGTQHENTRIVGSMAINNNVDTGMAWDDYNAIPNAVVENSVIYNSGNGITTNGNTRKDVTLNNVTVVANGTGISRYGDSDTIAINRSLFYNNGTALASSLDYNTTISDLYCYGNSGGQGNCNVTNVNPATNGLLHLPRIEDASTLKTAGTGGTQIGAQILNKIGVDGTFYGEANFNTEQGALWNWPNEDRIATDLCAVRASALCSAASLTDYVWSILGNATPANLAPMPKPTGVTVTKN